MFKTILMILMVFFTKAYATEDFLDKLYAQTFDTSIKVGMKKYIFQKYGPEQLKKSLDSGRDKYNNPLNPDESKYLELLLADKQIEELERLPQSNQIERLSSDDGTLMPQAIDYLTTVFKSINEGDAPSEGSATATSTAAAAPTGVTHSNAVAPTATSGDEGEDHLAAFSKNGVSNVPPS